MRHVLHPQTFPGLDRPENEQHGQPLAAGGYNHYTCVH